MPTCRFDFFRLLLCTLSACLTPLTHALGGELPLPEAELSKEAIIRTLTEMRSRVKTLQVELERADTDGVVWERCAWKMKRPGLHYARVVHMPEGEVAHLQEITSDGAENRIVMRDPNTGVQTVGRISDYNSLRDLPPIVAYRLWGNPHDGRPLEELLREKEPVLNADAGHINGENTCSLTLSSSGQVGVRRLNDKNTFYLSTDKSYAFVRYEFRRNELLMLEVNVLELKEIIGGVWFPLRMTLRGRDYRTSQESTSWEIRCTRVVGNEPIDDSVFDLQFDDGIRLFDTRAPNPLAGRPAPELDVAAWAHGERTDLAELRGKTVVLAFWDCADEDCPDLVVMLNGLMSGQSRSRIEVVSVHSSEADPDALKQFIADDEINYRVALDKPASERPFKGATFEKYSVRKLPAIFIIDRDGTVRYQDIALTAVEQAIKVLLAE